MPDCFLRRCNEFVSKVFDLTNNLHDNREIQATAMANSRLVYHYKVKEVKKRRSQEIKEKNSCIISLDNEEDRKMGEMWIPTGLAREGFCFILAGIILIANRIQFQFGKSLAFLLTPFFPGFLLLR
jgi:hypothetical protein